MKKLLTIILALLLTIGTFGCADQTSETTKMFEGNLRTYYEMSDGTWMCEGHVYRYRLEIEGTMPDAAVRSTFVYLSNTESIPFERAWRAAGLSSQNEDYFAVEDAVLVDWRLD